MSQNNARNYFKISQAALQLAKSTPDMKAQRQISIEISILFIYFLLLEYTRFPKQVLTTLCTRQTDRKYEG